MLAAEAAADLEVAALAAGLLAAALALQCQVLVVVDPPLFQ